MTDAQKATGPDRANDQPRQETNHIAIVPPSAAHCNAAQRKHVATIKAECAIRGYQVHETADGFLVTRWGLSRHCADLQALHCFARQIGASE